MGPGPERTRIVARLRELAADATNLDVKTLTGAAPWLRLRVGDYRVLGWLAMTSTWSTASCTGATSTERWAAYPASTDRTRPPSNTGSRAASEQFGHCQEPTNRTGHSCPPAQSGTSWGAVRVFRTLEGGQTVCVAPCVS